ncbi:MAG TPA: alpha-2-macroglobulin, partial [Lutibacter sp.]|nr:alpha-2-macroglobulin [Lutibacter sp.]
MKKVTLLIILFSTLIHAQKNYDNYDKLWKEVQQLEKDDLPKSANKKVAAIYKKATSDDNAPQLVKCLMHQSKYALIVEEEAILITIHNFESAINKAEFPTKNILESVLAGLYWQYFQQNRWQYYNRTNTSEKVDDKDFRTWDLHTIFKEIHTHYQNSLQNGLLAQQKPLADFNEILHTQKGSQDYRPSLYDFLAHNALNFYKTGESNLAQPSYKFEIENSNLLGKNEDFIKVDLTSKDTLSQKRLALKLFRNLTLFHHGNKNTKALVDLTLNRLDFVKTNARFPEV